MIATKDYIEKNFFISCYEEIDGHTYAVLDDNPQYVGWGPFRRRLLLLPRSRSRTGV